MAIHPSYTYQHRTYPENFALKFEVDLPCELTNDISTAVVILVNRATNVSTGIEACINQVDVEMTRTFADDDFSMMSLGVVHARPTSATIEMVGSIRDLKLLQGKYEQGKKAGFNDRANRGL